MTAKIDMLSFEAGLVDELVEARVTAVNHGRGCRRLENFLPLAQGPALTRPPSRRIAATKSQGAANLFTVTYSEEYSYLVEFGNGYCRFFTNAGQVLSGAAAYEIASPYDADEVFELQAFCDAGTLYLAHPDHAPYRLVYAAASSWTLTAVPFTWGPFLDENTGTTTLTPSGASGSITLTASAALFDDDHVGALWLLGHRTAERTLIHAFAGNATSTTIAVPKGATWSVTTTGAWGGTLIAEKSYDGGSTYETVVTYKSAEDTNYSDSGSEVYDECVYRVRMTSFSGTLCNVVFRVDPTVAYGYVTITAVNSALEAEATVVETLWATTATEIWAEGAWSAYRGYPRAVGLVDNRLTWAGTRSDPTTQWLSRVNDYTNMRTGTTADAALTFTFTTRKGDPFLWLLGEQYAYYIGTPSAVLQIQAADPASALSAVNKPEIRRRIEFGSAALQPVRAHATLILVDRSGLRPMKVTYDWEQDLLVGPPLAFACPTVTSPGIEQIVFQRGPVPTVWLRRSDGVLVAMAYEQLFREEITGFATVYTAGADAAIEAIGILPGDKGDVLWWVAARTVNGATTRSVERLDEVDLVPVRATAARLDSYVPWVGVDWTDVESVTVNETTGRVTIAATGHSFTNGMNIDFADVGGMTWLNERVLLVADAATDSFVLQTTTGSYVDGRLLGDWTSGGRVRQVENTFAGLGHLEGESVHVVADGNVLGPYTVASGGIKLARYYGRVTAGLYVPAYLSPLRLVLPLPDGSARGRQMSVAGVWLSVYRSWECQVGRDADHLRVVPFFPADPEPQTAPELATDDFYVTLEGGLTSDPTVLIVANQPLPLCVRGLMVDLGIGGTKAGRA